MSKLEYMTKIETKPFKDEFREIVHELKNEFYDDFSLSYRLVGSSKRNLVIKHHNQGFDLDYQIIIQKNKNDKTPEDIKIQFLNFFYDNYKDKYKIENSTSAITLKHIDQNESKIINSFDIVIIKEVKETTEILKRKKTKDDKEIYVFEKLRDHKNFKENFKKIKGLDLWTEVRETYLEKREEYLKKEPNKKSYLILMETVKEVIE